MAQSIIKCPHEPRTARNQNDRSPILLQSFTDIPQSPQVVDQMFNHVQANHRVKFLFLWIRLSRLSIRVTNMKVWPIPANIFEVCKIQTPDMVPRKPVRFLGLLGPRNGSRVGFPETACGFDSGPGREPRELAIDEAN